MKQKFILVDTNIFIQQLETGFKDLDYDLKPVKKLLNLLNNNKAKLLLPEIVRLEYKRIFNEKKKELSSEFDKIKTSATIKSSKSKKEIDQEIDKILEEKNRDQKEFNDVVEKLFSHKNREDIPLNNEIIVESYMYAVTEEKPYKKILVRADEAQPLIAHTIQPDCLIIESCHYFLKNLDNYLFLISTNDKDYFNEEGSDLDSNIKKTFKTTNIYKTLAELLNKEFNAKLPIKKEPKEKKPGQVIESSVVSSSASA